MERIQTYWHNQAIAEYTSSARTVELSHWMQRLAFSPELIRNAIRISDDEMVHAQMCYQVTEAAGLVKPLPLDTMGLSLKAEFENPRKSLLLVLVQSYCFGETVAVPLFSQMRKAAKEPRVLETFDRILDDEPRHAAFGWLALAWCMQEWPEAQEWLAEIVPIGLVRMRNAYSGGFDEFNPPLTKEEIAWGVFPRLRYGEILEKSIRTTYTERLKHYGIKPV